MNFRITLLVLGMIFGATATADDLQMIISARSIHEGGSERNLNERNYGLGLQYDFDHHPNWIPLISFASFKDSNYNTSRYLGAGIKRRFRLSSAPDTLNLDLGAAGLVMVRPDYNDEKPFLGMIPFVSLSNSWGGINATYVPAIEEDTFPFWYFQFSLKLMQF